MLIGAATAVLLPQRLDRVRRHGHRLTVLEAQIGDQVEQVSTLRQRVVRLEADELDVDARFSASEESLGALQDKVEAIQQSLDALALNEDRLEAVNQGLLEMQQFIVRAAEDARAQREQLVRPAPTAAVPQDMTEAIAPMARLMASLPQQQEVFAARRRAAAAATFRQPAGGGL